MAFGCWHSQIKLLKRIFDKTQTQISQRNISSTAGAVSRRVKILPNKGPVVFFNASARLGHLSLNAAFSLLAAWGLRLAGVPVVHFVCNQGMSRCVLGTNPDDPSQAPPCAACVAQSKRLYTQVELVWFNYSEEKELREKINKLTVPELMKFDYKNQALGELVTPGLRWALRRHNLQDDKDTRFLFREYILSAYNLGREFEVFLEKVDPQSVILFNGIMYPEAMARWVSLKRGIRVITHEVGLRPFSAFFTEGQATAYPMAIPENFELSAEQNKRLDAYLEERFQGRFTMAGIRFWPKMQPLDENFLRKAANFKHIVPVFTNVIFDTSQVHANTIFEHMFAWLDLILRLIKTHPKTLFVIRAHPDEARPGSRKQSRESVRQWVLANKVNELPNVIFVDSDEHLSSYALIARAHFVMVYNSSIGLEASILGKPVLCGGAARYTQYKTVYFPTSPEEYEHLAQTFLENDQVDQPAELVREARRVLYFQLFHTALPFEKYLDAHRRMGYVHLKSFPVDALLPANSPAIRTIYDGVISGQAFLV